MNSIRAYPHSRAWWNHYSRLNLFTIQLNQNKCVVGNVVIIYLILCLNLLLLEGFLIITRLKIWMLIGKIHQKFNGNRSLQIWLATGAPNAKEFFVIFTHGNCIKLLNAKAAMYFLIVSMITPLDFGICQKTTLVSAQEELAGTKAK